MRCDEIGILLDQLLDGELTDTQLEELRAHGRTCPSCAAEIDAAMQMKALFSEMSPEVDVPLPAQAAWRSAVKEESKRRRSRKFYSWAGMAAAAVVLVLGIGLAMKLPAAPRLHSDTASMPAVESAGAPEIEETQEPSRLAVKAESAKAAEPEGEASTNQSAVARGAEMAYDAGESIACEEEAAYGMADSAYLESDGLGAVDAAMPEPETTSMPAMEYAMEQPAEAAEEAEAYDADEAYESAVAAAPVHEIPLRVESVDSACKTILDLVSEYEGTTDVQRFDGGVNIYIDMPAGNVADFIRAVEHLDLSGAQLTPPAIEGETVSALLLTLTE